MPKGFSKHNQSNWKHLEETKRKMSLKRIGNKNPAWKGGITTPDHRKELTKIWKKKNYNKVLFSNLKRITKKLNAEGFHTFGEWELLKKQYGYTCPACGKKEPEIKLSQDHIIPISRGGSDYIENIQPLCKSCNSKKHTKIIKYNV